jgi:lipoprotein LprG
MSRPRALIALLALVVAGLAGCSKDSKAPVPANLPDGTTLTTAAAAAMRDTSAAHITFDLDANASTMPLRRAEGDLTQHGKAKGSIQLDQTGSLIEYQFVLLDGFVYLKGVSGGWQKLPASAAASIYDPAVVLDPDRGMARLLATTSEATTVGTESIDGVDTYKVTVSFDGMAVAALVPGITGRATGVLWVNETTKQLRRAVLTVTPTTGGKNGTATMNFFDINKPVQVSAPA